MLDLLWGGVDLLLSLLTTSSQAEHQVQGGFLLNVVVGQGASVFQLLSGKDKTLNVGASTYLLIRRDPFFVLDFGLDVFNRIGGFDLEGDGLAGKSFNKDLHSDDRVVTNQKLMSLRLLD